MADWCVAIFVNNLRPPKKRRTGILANNGYWCEYTLQGSVTIDYTGVVAESGSGVGSVTGSNGSFVFTPPSGLNLMDVVLYGGGGGAGGGSSGTEGCVGGCGYNGIPGKPGGAGQKLDDTIVPGASHSFTIGTGGTFGTGGGNSNSQDNHNPGNPGVAGGATIFDGMPTPASGGIRGEAGDGQCGGGPSCGPADDGADSEIGTGGAGGESGGDDSDGTNGGNGGLSAGGGGGGGGGGGDQAGDDGESGGDGGSGGNGRVTLNWYEHNTPALLATWC